MRTSTKRWTGVTDRDNGFGCDIFIGDSPPIGGEGARPVGALACCAPEANTVMLDAA